MNVNIYQNQVTISDTEVSSSKYIHVVQLLGVNGPSTRYENYTYTSSTFTLAVDGYYTITQLMLPTTPDPGTYYILEGVTDQIINPDGDPISISQLLEVDPTGTTITREDEEWFGDYLIRTYYINLLKKKYLNNICNCDCINKQDKLMIDTLTMGLALIEELNVYTQYYESQRIIEKLNKCLGNINATNCDCNG